MKKERPGQEPVEINLQRSFDAWMKTEGPKIDAFHSLLTTQARLLREGKIDERVFFERVTESKEPVSFMFRYVDEESGMSDMLDVDRTNEGKLKITTRQVAAWPQLTVTLGLSKDGRLAAENVDAEYTDPDTIVKPHKVEGDTIFTDVIDVGNIGGTSKQAAGKELIRLLTHVVPFEDRPQTEQPRSTI